MELTIDHEHSFSVALIENAGDKLREYLQGHESFVDTPIDKGSSKWNLYPTTGYDDQLDADMKAAAHDEDWNELKQLEQVHRDLLAIEQLCIGSGTKEDPQYSYFRMG